MPIALRHTLLIAATSMLVAVPAGCGGTVEFSFGDHSPAEAAVDLIEGDEMAQRLGLDSITDAVCDDPIDEKIGTVFSCTADSDGATVEFEVTIEEDDRIFAGPTNVVDRSFLADYAVSAVASLNNANGFTLPTDAMDCGSRSVVLDADRQMTCLLTDPDTGTVYEAAMTIRDTELGTFDVEILDPIG